MFYSFLNPSNKQGIQFKKHSLGQKRRQQHQKMKVHYGVNFPSSASKLVSRSLQRMRCFKSNILQVFVFQSHRQQSHKQQFCFFIVRLEGLILFEPTARCQYKFYWRILVETYYKTDFCVKLRRHLICSIFQYIRNSCGNRLLSRSKLHTCKKNITRLSAFYRWHWTINNLDRQTKGGLQIFLIVYNV